MTFDLNTFTAKEYEDGKRLQALVTKNDVPYAIANDGKPWFVGYKFSQNRNVKNFTEYATKQKESKVPGCAIKLTTSLLADFKEMWNEDNKDKDTIHPQVTQLWVCDWKFALHFLSSMESNSVVEEKDTWKKEVKREVGLILQTHIDFQLELQSLKESHSKLREEFEEYVRKNPPVQQRSKVVESSSATLELNPFKKKLFPKLDLLDEDIQEIPVVALSSTLRTSEGKDEALNLLVRRYALDNNLDFDVVWNNLYAEYKKIYKIDLKLRTKRHRPKLSSCQYAKHYGFLDNLYELAKKVLSSRE